MTSEHAQLFARGMVLDRCARSRADGRGGPHVTSSQGLGDAAARLLATLATVGPEEITVEYPDGEATAELVERGYAAQGRYGPFPTLCITEAGREALR